MKLTTPLIILFSVFYARYSFCIPSQFEQIKQATMLYEQQQYADSIPIFEKITALNANNGRYWYQLANSYYQIKQFDAAIEAYRKAVNIGYNKAYAEYNIASIYGLQGKAEESIQWLIEARKHKMPDVEQSLLNDNDFALVRNSQAYMERAFPKLADNASREDKWRTDIEFFSTRIQETHYQLFTHFDKTFWDNEIKRIKNAVPNLQDHELYLQLLQLLSRVKDGHSVIVPPFSGIQHFHSVPLRLGSFSDGIYVQAADPKYQQLIGAKVVAIGNTPIADVLKLYQSIIFGDNEFGAHWFTTRWFLTIPEILDALKLINNKQAIAFTLLSGEGKEFQIEVTGELLDPSQFGLVEQPSGWLTMATDNQTPALWQQQAESSYWSQYLSQDKIMYVKLNRVRNDGKQTLQQFFEQVLKEAEDNNAKALTIDLRSNNGGDGSLNRHLIAALQRSSLNKKGQLFILIGNKTFSAAHQLALELEQNTQAIFIGEPTGSSAVYRGESNSVLLPNTGTMVMVASRQFQAYLSDDYRKSLAPDIEIKMSAEQYKKNEDPVLKAILDSLKD